jgi:protein-tyrosine phosphatase
MAAAILRVRGDQAGLPIEVDSAGTSAWHVGADAHPATRHELGSRGIGCAHTARQFTARDFPVADLVLAMDRANREVLLELALSPADRRRIHLIRSFDPTAASDAEVPDPYHDGPDRYREVFDMLDAACSGVLERLRSHGPPP